jgi:hypothetical protein
MNHIKGVVLLGELLWYYNKKGRPIKCKPGKEFVICIPNTGFIIRQNNKLYSVYTSEYQTYWKEIDQELLDRTEARWMKLFKYRYGDFIVNQLAMSKETLTDLYNNDMEIIDSIWNSKLEGIQLYKDLGWFIDKDIIWYKGRQYFVKSCEAKLTTKFTINGIHNTIKVETVLETVDVNKFGVRNTIVVNQCLLAPLVHKMQKLVEANKSIITKMVKL